MVEMQILDINQKDYDQKRPIYEDIKTDTAFRKISPKAIGFYIWRIQNDHVEAIPREQYGTFYDENTYVIYSASLAGTTSDRNTICREIKSPGAIIERYIHFWLGANITSDRSKSAAYKIIELDLHLDHKTTQYRESQGHEGIRFLSYFKDDGMLIQSGTDSSTYPQFPRLYQIKGKTTPQCIQQKAITWQHFNCGHVMILQTPTILFVWVGRSTSSCERIFGLKIGTKLKDQFQIPEISVVDDGYEQSMSPARKDIWNSFLSLSQRFVQPLTLAPSNADVVLKLYQCDTVNGVFRVELVKTGSLEQTDLYGRDNIYIIDYFCNGVWIWIGRSSHKQNRAEAMRHVRGYVIKKGYPASTPVARVIDGLEPAEFIDLFPNWVSSDVNGNSIKTLSEKFDALTLIQRPKLAAQIQLMDDGTGDATVYQIGVDDAKEIPKKYAKTFYSGNCYIVHYQISCTSENTISSLANSIKNVVYLWTGSNASAEYRQTGEAFLGEMCNHLKKHVVQVRISEGMEPPHFLQIFKGGLIIFNTKSPSLEAITNPRKHPSSFVLKVVGNSTYTCKAVQVSSKTLYYPEDCYILKAPDNEIWIWCGQYSTGDSREMAKSIASNLGEYNLVMESNETDQFFSSVGEKFLKQLKKTHGTIVAPTMNVAMTWERQRVGLYMCSIEQEKYVLNKIFGFTQKDLRPENIFLLDAGNIVYVWIGEFVSSGDRTQCWDLANHLITTHPVQRDIKMPIAIVRQGEEPITFIGFFEQWDKKYYENYVPFEKIRAEMEIPGTPIPVPRGSVHSDSASGDDFDRYQKYPLDMLRGDPTNLPSSINPTRKEIHLTHDDFVNVFKMPYHDFEELPKWKQVELKKQNKLF
ncbi:villin-like protein quail isoform X1 [Toxorhynchites rutilus septentrionalis]|uniref:villin-like protein quail isoform X1 n=1 Tax=Toxorhynchites rutilus septentrionalis TaxID=329112 RepID=UPI0024792CA6|nr:villin-like protein quail isoform X1 [Toxorhynchites rutilus septentrionalis]